MYSRTAVTSKPYLAPRSFSVEVWGSSETIPKWAEKAGEAVPQKCLDLNQGGGALHGRSRGSAGSVSTVGSGRGLTDQFSWPHSGQEKR